MPATPDALFAYLHAHGIATTTAEHAAVFTVEDSRALRGSLPGAHTKNLFLRDNKRRFFLVTLEEGRAVDLKSLRPMIGAKGGLSFASPEALMEHLGIAPGSVSPFALLNDGAGLVTFAIDRQLLEDGVVNIHPLRNTMTTAVGPADLLAFVKATGHETMVLDFDAAPPVGEPG